jgi:hypothetical protein
MLQNVLRRLFLARTREHTIECAGKTEYEEAEQQNGDYPERGRLRLYHAGDLLYEAVWDSGGGASLLGIKGPARQVVVGVGSPAG